MTTYVFRPDHHKFPIGQKMIEKSEVPPEQRGRRFHIIADFPEPVRSAIDGKHYASRKAYTAHVKGQGCEIVGNDLNNVPMDREASVAPGVEADIARSIGELS